MNWLDILIILFLLLLCLLGFISGFLRKVFSLIGLIAGFILALKLSKPISNLLVSNFKFPSTVGYIVAFIFVVLIIYLLSLYLAKFFSNLNSATKMIDKILGMLLGFLQGLILTSIILYNLNYANLPEEAVKSQSILYSKIIKVAPLVFDKIVSSLTNSTSLNEYYKKIIE
jgi:membrane protein required for colicin V production